MTNSGCFELAIHRLLDVVEVLVFRQLVKLTAQVIFPVRPLHYIVNIKFWLAGRGSCRYVCSVRRPAVREKEKNWDFL